MLVYVIAALVVLPVVVLVVGAIQGRVAVRSCCAVEPERDLRMRAAFTEDAERRTAEC